MNKLKGKLNIKIGKPNEVDNLNMDVETIDLSENKNYISQHYKRNSKEVGCNQATLIIETKDKESKRVTNELLITKDVNGSLSGEIKDMKDKNELKKEEFKEKISKVKNYTLDNTIGNSLKQEKPKVLFNISEIEIGDCLGNGVSGQVFKAKHINTGKLFALKIIPYKEDKKLKDLIEFEIKTLYKCKCEHIIKCYASYLLDDSVRIILEYMNKGTLTDILKKIKKIPESIIGLMTVQILKGIVYLHQNKIIHRDIKPSNILVNSKGFIKISDFGVSGFLKDSADERHTMLGTYLYMSPERIRGNAYTSKSDIWSFGMSIMECVTGMNPFLYNNQNRQVSVNNYWDLVSLLDSKEDSPKLSIYEFSEELCDFVNCCLIKQPERRYSAEELYNHKFNQMYKDIPISELKSWIDENI